MESYPHLMFNYYDRDEGRGINTAKMRSTLLQIMLEEVATFCQHSTQWSHVYQQVQIYT